ncbi:MAG: MFS transporter [Rhodoferax sp.]|nr:MFS transporter [Rhodoferax sp.]
MPATLPRRAAPEPVREARDPPDPPVLSRPSTLPELQAHYGERYRWLLLLAVMVGAMASIMSSTIITVAVPDMSRHFAIGQERAQWVSSGFMAAMTVAMLATPWLLGRFGYRRTYGGSMLLLLAGGVVGGIAGSYPLVLACRIAEGIAAGVVQPIPAIIVMRAFQPHEQGRAMSVFGLGAVLAPALGPTVGGVLVDLFGWRSIFFMVVPFCLASLWMSSRFVPSTPPGGGATGGSDKPLDALSLLLAAAGTLGLLNGLVQLHAGRHGLSGALLLGAVVLLAGFILRQRRLAAGRDIGARVAPLMDLSVYADRRFAMGSGVAFIYGMALFGSTYLLPIYMQLGLQLSATFVGTLLLPASLALALTIATVGRLAGRWSTHGLVSTGLVLLALSFLLVFFVQVHTSLWLIVSLVVLGRMGLGCILPSLNVGAMQGLSRALIPQGASAINYARTLGGAVGVGLCGIVLEWRLAVHGDVLSVPGSGPARLAAFNETFLMLSVLCGVALLVARGLRGPVPPRLKHG